MNSRLLETISDVVLVVNDQATIVDVSNSVKDLFLYAKEEIIGQKLSILLPERFRRRHDLMFHGYTKNPVPRRMGLGMVLMALDKNGVEFDIDVALSAYKEGDQIRYTAIIRDVSDMKEMERKLIKNNEELISKNKELDHFAHILSHDLKAPARNVMQLIEIIEESHVTEFSNEVKKCFSLIKNSSQRMGILIDGILSYSRAGRTNLEISDFELSELFSEVLATINTNDRFIIDLPNDKVTLRGNKIQLGQVLANLIDNAIKYHHKDNGRIIVSFNETGEFYEFSVEDNGPGIPKKYHVQIFEMFGTAHESSKIDSTGIGLAIVKKIIAQNDGTIDIRSVIDQGTQFTFNWKKQF